MTGLAPAGIPGEEKNVMVAPLHERRDHVCRRKRPRPVVVGEEERAVRRCPCVGEPGDAHNLQYGVCLERRLQRVVRYIDPGDGERIGRPSPLRISDEEHARPYRRDERR